MEGKPLSEKKIGAERTFIHLVEHTVNQKRNRIFATWYNNKGKLSDERTFGDIWDEAGMIAYYLRKQWNIKKGERIIICHNFGLQFFSSLLGCLRAGVVAVLVYPPHPPRIKSLPKMARVIEDCNPCLILVDSDVKKIRLADLANPMSKCRKLWPKNIRFKSTDEIKKKNVFFDEKTNPEDIAFIQYTSGSTGDPKGVMVTYKALDSNINMIHHGYRTGFENDGGVPDEFVGFSWLPQYHDLGLVCAGLAPFAGGWRMHMMAPMSFIQNPLLWLDLMSRKEVNIGFAPDFAYNLTARKFIEARESGKGREPIPGLDLSHVHNLMNCAEPIKASTRKTISDLFVNDRYKLRKNWFLSGYGLAESVVCVCWIHGYHLSLPRDEDQFPFVAVGSRDTFHSSMTAKIVDQDTFLELEDGITGELWISGPSVASGYFNRLKLTEEVFHAKMAGSEKNFLRTGDLAFFQDDKLFICGRIKDLIIANGVNYYPQDIENAVQEASCAVRPGCVAAFSASDTVGDGLLGVVFEIRHSYTQQAADIIQQIRCSISRNVGLSASKVVAITERSIRKTTSGKIRRRETRAALLNGELDIVFSWQNPVSTLQGALQEDLDTFHYLPKDNDINASSGAQNHFQQIQEVRQDNFSDHPLETCMQCFQSEKEVSSNDQINNQEGDLGDISVEPCDQNAAMRVEEITIEVVQQKVADILGGSPEYYEVNKALIDYGANSLALSEILSWVDSLCDNGDITNLDISEISIEIIQQYIAGGATPSRSKATNRNLTLPSTTMEAQGHSTADSKISKRCLSFLYPFSFIMTSLGMLNLGFALFKLPLKVMQDLGWKKALICIPPVYTLWLLSLMIFCTLFKWCIIGKYQPGNHSIYSFYFWRWWTVDRLLTFCHHCGIAHFRGSQLYTVWLKLLGCNIHPSARVNSLSVSEVDLVHIGSSCKIHNYSTVRGASIDTKGMLYLGSVYIGNDSEMLPHSYAGPGTMVPDSTVLAACTKSEFHSELDCYQRKSENVIIKPVLFTWLGCTKVITTVLADILFATASGYVFVAASIPAYLLFGKLAEMLNIIPVNPYTGTFIVDFLDLSEGYYIFALLQILPPFFIPFIGILLESDLYTIIEHVASRHYIIKVAAVFASAFVVFGVSMSLCVVLIYWFLLGCENLAAHCRIPSFLEPDKISFLADHSYRRFQILMVGSEGLNVYYRLMGASIGANCRILLSQHMRFPGKIKFGAKSVVSRDASIEGVTEKIFGKTEKSETSYPQTRLGEYAILGCISHLAKGSNIQNRATLAPLSSTTSRNNQIMTSTVRVGASRFHTFPQNRLAAQERGGVEAFLMTNFAWPLHGLVSPALFAFIQFTFAYGSILFATFLQHHLGLAAAWILSPISFTAYLTLCIGAGIITKWVLLHRITDGQQKQLSSWFFQRYIFAESIIESSRYYGQVLFIGTRMHNFVLKLLGSQICINGPVILTNNVSHYDGIHVGGSVVCRDAVLEGAWVHESTSGEHFLQFSQISVADQVCIGDKTVLVGGATIKHGGSTKPLALIFHDQVIGKSAQAGGCPAVRLDKAKLSDTPHCGNLQNDVDELVNSILGKISRDSFCVLDENDTEASSQQKTVKKVLITGANGFLGIFIIKELLCCDPECHVYGLVRRKRGRSGQARMKIALDSCRVRLSPEEASRLHIIEGFLSEPNFGLELDSYMELATQCTSVVHTAASIDFSAAYRQSSSNSRMLTMLVHFAMTKKKKHFIHVSTIFAQTFDMADKYGIIGEGTKLGNMRWEIFLHTEWSNGYAQSKWVSEQVLIELAMLNHFPLTILRPSRVIGSAKTGYIPEQHIFHIIHDMIVRRIAPDSHGRISLTCVDHFAEATACIALESQLPGEDQHWARGYNVISPGGILTLRQIADVIESLGHPKIQTIPFHEWREWIKEDQRNLLWHAVCTFANNLDDAGVCSESSGIEEIISTFRPSIHSKHSVIETLKRNIEYIFDMRCITPVHE